MNNNEYYCFYEAYAYHLALITDIEVERYRKWYEEEIESYQRLNEFNRKYNLLFGKL